VKLDPGLILRAVKVTEAAALGVFPLLGNNDQKACDAAAVAAMREAFHALPIAGTVVIGEGERDEAPMLFIGEKVGSGRGPKLDIALDPLEGTALAAKGIANALSVLALSPEGGLLNAPDTYMEKMAIGPGFPAGILDLDMGAGALAKALADHRKVKPSALTACVMDRPRHDKIIAELKGLGCGLKLIDEGDVAGAMKTALPGTGIDFFLGIGGAPEGVLAAAALKCLGGQFKGRLVFRNDDEQARAKKWGITDLKRVYERDELASDEVVLILTGVTDGDLVKGVGQGPDGHPTFNSLILHSESQSIRWLTSRRLKD
jgi:fructose-1,6-bisphosphatase II / sedoheptulose-1,7-bisphosphatase